VAIVTKFSADVLGSHDRFMTFPIEEFLNLGSLIEAVNDFISMTPTPRTRSFQLDYQTWHARLEGCNPVEPKKTASEVDTLASEAVVAKAA
jgi:hypothetical protein